METISARRLSASSNAGQPSPGRRRVFHILLAGSLALSAAGCGGHGAADNRNPDMRHGNIEKPGTHAVDN